MGTITNFYCFEPPKTAHFFIELGVIIMAESREDAVIELRKTHFLGNRINDDGSVRAPLFDDNTAWAEFDKLQKTQTRYIGGSRSILLSHSAYDKLATLFDDMKKPESIMKITKPYEMKALDGGPPGDVPQYIRPDKKIQNNDPCHCGSGKKFKNCCKK